MVFVFATGTMMNANAIKTEDTLNEKLNLSSDKSITIEEVLLENTIIEDVFMFGCLTDAKEFADTIESRTCGGMSIEEWSVYFRAAASLCNNGNY